MKSADADLNIMDVPDDDELDPGGYVGLNCDRKTISLSIEPVSLSSGTVKLDITSGTSKIEVWDALTGGNKVIPDGQNYYKTWTVDSQPDTLYVKGIATGASELELSFTNDAVTCEDEVKFTVLEVDLDIGAVADEDEESVGGFIALNDNDDNDNDTPDKDESGPVTGELDLIQIILQEVLPTNLTGNVTLKKVPSDSTKIKIWESYTKGGSPITLPKTYATPADLPKSLYVEGYSPSASVRDVTLALEFTIVGKTFDDKVKITVIDVDYTEDESQTYGYDSYTDSPTIDYFPYKSVKVGDSDTVYADSSMPDEVYFTSSNTGNVTVSPSQPSSTHQQVTFTGVSEGFAQGLAELYDPVQYDIIAAAIGVYSYDQDSYTLAFRVVHEEDDDVPVIPVGQGKPNETAITAGGNSTLDTTPSGDDTIVGTTITTGSDGVCNTTAAGDDVQVIPINQGKPNQTCITAGTNTKRDTNTSGDDGVSGENIHTGSDGICNTTADNTDDPSTDPYNAGPLQNYLNNVIYKQSVVEWADVTEETATAVNWDLNRDGELDVSTSGWTSEQNVIINNCDPGDYDSVVFIVNNPDESWGGCAGNNQKYAFVFPDVSPNEEDSTAHELGHCEFGLDDLEPPGSSDEYNLMWYEYNEYQWRLRKGQWIDIQAKQ